MNAISTISTSLILTRSQKRALAYASSTDNATLRQSGNKIDLILAREIELQGERAKARKNNNAIHSMVVARYGSDSSIKGVSAPTSPKTIALAAWVADMAQAVKGEPDSTDKARQSRDAVINARFGDLFAMVAELATAPTTAPTTDNLPEMA